MKIEKYTDAAGEKRWRLKAGNGEIVMDGSEGYASYDNLERAIEINITNLVTAAVAGTLEVVDLDTGDEQKLLVDAAKGIGYWSAP